MKKVPRQKFIEEKTLALDLTKRLLQELETLISDDREFISEDQLRRKLLGECLKAGSQRAWGEAHGGYKQPFISMVISGSKPVPDAIVSALGYARVVRYVERRER